MDSTYETFTHSWRGLLRQYTYLHNENGALRDWRYRYSAGGEREQKRLYGARDENHNLLDEKPWVYYLLGGSKEQLAVYHAQEKNQLMCEQMPGYSAYIYPVEYNTFGGRTVRLTTRPHATATNGVKEYILTDHLGSTRVRVDEGGTVLGTTDYEPFGAAITGEPRQGYIGKEKDIENGLGDFGVRKYDAELGRFLSVDALWEKYRAWTPYHYGANNPISNLDPDGEEVIFASIQDEVDFNDAITYLQENGVNTFPLKMLLFQKGYQVAMRRVDVTDGSGEQNEFRPGGKYSQQMLYWDPNGAKVYTGDDGAIHIQSPAMSLLHEGYHAWLYNNNASLEKQWYNAPGPNPGWTNYLEFMIITNIETPAAIQAGEVTSGRQCHDCPDMRYIKVDGPRGRTEVVDSKKKKGGR